jgi:hypothetical protein
MVIAKLHDTAEMKIRTANVLDDLGGSVKEVIIDTYWQRLPCFGSKLFSAACAKGIQQSSCGVYSFNLLPSTVTHGVA